MRIWQQLVLSCWVIHTMIRLICNKWMGTLYCCSAVVFRSILLKVNMWLKANNAIIFWSLNMVVTNKMPGTSVQVAAFAYRLFLFLVSWASETQPLGTRVTLEPWEFQDNKLSYNMALFLILIKTTAYPNKGCCKVQS